MSALTCFHCGEPVPDGEAPLLACIGELRHPVCCIGCQAAAEWIAGLGLQDYYRLRDAAPPRARSGADFAAWDRPQLRRFYVHERDDGCAEVEILVEGMRCPACSWLIERALGAVAGVRETSVNVLGRRTAIVWDPRVQPLSAVLAAIARLGYAPHPLDRCALDGVAAREQRAALKRLVVAGLGMMQAMTFAVVLYAGALEGIDAPTRDFFRWIGLLVTLPVIAYAARPFFAGALADLRARRPGMDTPVAVAVVLVFAASVIETLRGGNDVYFDSASMFVFLLLGGRWLEMRTRHRAADVVDALARLQPATAQRRTPTGELEIVGVHELEPGDRVVVAAGAVVPADGALARGACRVDESLLSGESRPLRRGAGERLIAGSVVVDGPAEIDVERTGARTCLSAIVRLVGRAQRQRPDAARQGERLAGMFVAGLIVAALATALAWLAVEPARALPATLAVLVVACPCAFALAVPAALARAVVVLAQRGVLVLTPNAMDALTRADHFVFDKTGTLGERRLALRGVATLGARGADECVAIAAGLEAGGTHPIAQALVAEHARRTEAARGAGTPVHLAPAQAVRNVPGFGVEGDVGAEHFRLGRAQFAVDGARDDADDVVLSGPGGVLARFELRERPRDDAAATLAALRGSGASVEILSGDSAARVRTFADACGSRIPWSARATPADKLERLAALRASGRTVAVVGDGVNDAPALAGADLAVAVGGGADLAHAHADVVLAGDRLAGLVDARAIAAAAQRVMRENMRWALAYNAVSVPLAALGLVPPWLAAIGMSLSSLAVVANSLRIRVARAATPRPPVLAATPAPAQAAA